MKFNPGQKVKIIDMDECLERDNDYTIGQICEVCEFTMFEDMYEKYTVWTEDKSTFWFFTDIQLNAVE